jgi:hypothetical protein
LGENGPAFEPGPQVAGQMLGRCIPRGHGFLQALQADRFQVLGNSAVKLSGAGRVVVLKLSMASPKSVRCGSPLASHRLAHGVHLSRDGASEADRLHPRAARRSMALNQGRAL